jgi:type II secretory pathway component PulF
MGASGSEVLGQIDAANEAEAQAQLRARGYSVTGLQEITTGSVQVEPDVEPQNVVSRDGSAKLVSQTQRSHRVELLWGESGTSGVRSS